MKKPVVDTQKIMTMSKHIVTKGNHITKEDSNRGNKEWNIYKTVRKKNEQNGNINSLQNINNYFKY